MLHVFVLMMCNRTAAFAKMQQYRTVGISTPGNIFQKCPKSLNSAFIRACHEAIFASLEKYSETSKPLSSEHGFIAAEVPGLV